MGQGVCHELLHVVGENCDVVLEVLRIFHPLSVAVWHTVLGDESVTRVQRNTRPETHAHILAGCVTALQVTVHLSPDA